MTPEEFAAKWEGKTSGGWTIESRFVKDRFGWNVILRNDRGTVGLACFDECGNVLLARYTDGCGNLIHRKVQRWVMRADLKEGMTIVGIDKGRPKCTVATRLCVVWPDGMIRPVEEMLDTEYLIEESA